ncbi:MAG TPA: hypothetical protein VKM93_11075 [Terriglobia bacterium]|nr:hypothetical protein [Terriglobia bacterium]
MLAQSKRLASDVSVELSGDFFGFGRARETSEADLLIQQGLLAGWGERTDQGLLNLKDLLAVVAPRRSKGAGVEGPAFRAESRQITPFASKNVQATAQNGGFSARFFEVASGAAGVSDWNGRTARSALPTFSGVEASSLYEFLTPFLCLPYRRSDKVKV